jgi:hypothetical protein
MFSLEYQDGVGIVLDKTARAWTQMVLVHGTKRHTVNRLLLDTGANVTLLSKGIADSCGIPIVRKGHPVVFGFYDSKRAKDALTANGMTGEQAEGFLASFEGDDDRLIKELRLRGIKDVGLVCDTRKIDSVELRGFIVEDVIIATPCDEGAAITQVLAMNVLEKFHFGFDLRGAKLYLGIRDGVSLYAEPRYKCGKARFTGTTDEPKQAAQSPEKGGAAKGQRAHMSTVLTQSSGDAACDKQPGQIVYWLVGGSVYHTERGCASLKKSGADDVMSGTIEQSGKTQQCRWCGH